MGESLPWIYINVVLSCVTCTVVTISHLQWAINHVLHSFLGLSRVIKVSVMHKKTHFTLGYNTFLILRTPYSIIRF